VPAPAARGRRAGTQPRLACAGIQTAGWL